MKPLNFKLSLVLILILVFNAFTFAQETYKASVNESKVIIEGTSNLHDWEMSVETLKSTLVMKPDSNEINSVHFEVPVKSMKSGKNRMDKNTYEALKEEKHEQISFSSSAVEESDNKYYATGKLSIAGVSKNVKIPFDISKQNNQLALNLSYEINMLDYKVEPPAALFGTITTGDKVNVNINLIFK
ncbi:YceI family protein [Mesohalobacter halotolerans]|uniref:YceI family protein n=1 Tax=Mesohalobacter halotolerans TaxID=1883405 RepID=A0A4U5TSL3_9FLAO|nr:YceI family protein [Mesohalobacter halotolerans]MBS3737579.1 YceI family protein [Psychroflexus sp.]TKS57299.1 YceI family protein [Mesohalobacter halotolerans]